MELQVLEQNVIVQAFATQGGTDALFERIAEQARSFVPDVTTRKGREEIGSVAMKVSKSKTLTEKYAKDLVAEEKARIKLIDDDRIQFCKKMDSLRDEILAPRDAWEQAEKDRVGFHKQCIQDIKDMLKEAVDLGFNSTQIKSSIGHLENLAIDVDGWEEFIQEAQLAKFETLELLRKTLSDREKYEAKQAELDRLRQAEQVRIQQERDAQIAREATEKAQREARLKAEKEAAELREQALKQKSIDDAKQAEITKQQAIEAERQRIEAEQFAKSESERKEIEAREADVAHKKRICSEALAALVKIGVDAEMGKKILKAINAKSIPNVILKF